MFWEGRDRHSYWDFKLIVEGVSLSASHADLLPPSPPRFSYYSSPGWEAWGRSVQPPVGVQSGNVRQYRPLLLESQSMYRRSGSAPLSHCQCLQTGKAQEHCYFSSTSFCTRKLKRISFSSSNSCAYVLEVNSKLARKDKCRNTARITCD